MIFHHPSTIRFEDATRFAAQCRVFDIAVPVPLERGLELVQVAERHRMKPGGTLLAMSDDEARDWITATSIHSHEGYSGSTGGMAPGIADFRDQVLAEACEATLPELERIVVELQPRFDETVAPFMTAARQYGITFSTTPDAVLDMEREGAVEAFRAARDAWAAVRPLAKFRILMTRAFNLAPTEEAAASDLGLSSINSGMVSHSVLFAAGDNWEYDETYNIDRRPGEQLDWLALAVGGLRLNTPAEVDRKVRA